MGSSRVWFGSGAVLAGVGAGMIFGTGAAGADTGSDSGSATGTPATSASPSPSPAAARAARFSRGIDARRMSAVASTIAAVREAPAAVTARAAAALPARASAAAAPGFALNRFNRADRLRPTPPTAVPDPVVPVPVVPSPDPVDPAQFAGTYYEQGSVKQFFSIGLVNTKAVYALNPDGTIRVENSGNYFFNRGPRSSIVGSAVPVNADNTALNVGFGGTPSANPPGNYTILAHAPDYSWVIVSDPSGNSGYILTRDKNISAEQYQQLLAQARALGVRGNITPTTQYR